MPVSDEDLDFRVVAKVVARGAHVSLLVDSPILGLRNACRVNVAIESQPYEGLGVALDANTVLLIIDAPTLGGQHEVGSSLYLSLASHNRHDIAFDHACTRLRSLLKVESLGSLSDRAARHALLFILEARNLDVRRQRLDVLKAALATNACFERSEQRDVRNP